MATQESTNYTNNDVPLRPDWNGVITDPNEQELPIHDMGSETQAQYAVEGADPTTQELLNYSTVPLPDGVVDEWPGLFYTEKTGQIYQSSNYRPIPAVGGFTNIPAPGILTGISIAETAGAAAYVRLHDGYDANAPLLCVIKLLAGTSQTINLGNVRPRFRYGVFVEVVTGTVEGTLYANQELVK